MSKQPAIPWSSQEEELYLSLLKEGMATGEYGERFKADFHRRCLDRMKPQFPHTNAYRLNLKRAFWRKKWTLFQKLYGKTGWSFSEETGYFTAEPVEGGYAAVIGEL